VIDALEDANDVQDVYTNIDIPDGRRRHPRTRSSWAGRSAMSTAEVTSNKARLQDASVTRATPVTWVISPTIGERSSRMR